MVFLEICLLQLRWCFRSTEFLHTTHSVIKVSDPTLCIVFTLQNGRPSHHYLIIIEFTHHQIVVTFTFRGWTECITTIGIIYAII